MKQRRQKKEESTEYLDYVTAGIKLWGSDSLELKLTNVSNETISYGEGFTMEVLHDGTWEKLPVLLEDYGFHDISYELEPGEYRFIDIDFAWLYGELREGWFRIIKEIYLQDGTVIFRTSRVWGFGFQTDRDRNFKRIWKSERSVG